MLIFNTPSPAMRAIVNLTPAVFISFTVYSLSFIRPNDYNQQWKKGTVKLLSGVQLDFSINKQLKYT